MTILSDVQKLEPGEKIQLVEVDGSAFRGPVLRFHAYNLRYTHEEIEKAEEKLKLSGGKVTNMAL